MAATSQLYPNPTLISGSKRQLTATAVATASNTKASQAALALQTLTIQWTPEATTSTAATIPAAGTAWNSIGWESLSALDALGDGGVTRASNVTVDIDLTAGTAGTVGTTVILYINGAEIGRSTVVSTNIATGGTQVGVLVPINAGVAFTAGAKLQMAVYSTLPTNASLNAITYTFNYGTSNASNTNIPPVTYTINAIRSGSDALPTLTDTGQRGQSISKTASDVLPASADTAPRQTAVFRTGTSLAGTLVDTAIRIFLASKIASDATSSGVDTASRTNSTTRTASDATTQVDTATRALIKSITITEPNGTTQVDTAIKSITYGRQATHYFVPTDPAITVPTKHIAGVVRNASDGSVFLGGASVYLVRDSDGLVCQMTTSSTSDGTYSFVRDQYDTNTYTVRGSATVNSMSEQDITRSGLVPV